MAERHLTILVCDWCKKTAIAQLHLLLNSSRLAIDVCGRHQKALLDKARVVAIEEPEEAPGEPPEAEVLTTTEAARMLNVTTGRVQQLIQSGDLPAHRGKGGTTRSPWLIKREDLANLVKERATQSKEAAY